MTPVKLIHPQERPKKRSFQVLESTCARFAREAKNQGKAQWAALDEAMKLWLAHQAV